MIKKFGILSILFLGFVGVVFGGTQTIELLQVMVGPDGQIIGTSGIQQLGQQQIQVQGSQGARKGVVDVFTRLNVRSGPGTSFSIVGKLYPGDPVNITGEQNGWYSIAWHGSTAWVCGTYVRTSASGIRNGAIAPEINQYLGANLAISQNNSAPANYSGYSYSSSGYNDYGQMNNNNQGSTVNGNNQTQFNQTISSNQGNSTNGVLNVPIYSQGRVGAKYPSGFCGPTSAKMVLEYYGIKADVNYLGLKDVGGDTPMYIKGSGSKAAGIKDMMIHCGLKNTTLSHNNSLSDLQQAVSKGYPVIVGVNGNYGPRTSRSGHYLVVVGMTNSTITFNDPGNGKRHTVSLRTFQNAWKQRNNRAIICRP
jgi:uncharacterized protein YvpB/SH3-like domain-containing protein